jgi:hypothetical protein
MWVSFAFQITLQYRTVHHASKRKVEKTWETMLAAEKIRPKMAVVVPTG